jgi:hypothetical protein
MISAALTQKRFGIMSIDLNLLPGTPAFSPANAWIGNYPIEVCPSGTDCFR